MGDILMDRRYYTVGDHRFCIEMPGRSALWQSLTSYSPFECDTDEALLFTLVVEEGIVTKPAGMLTGRFGEEGSTMDLYRSGTAYTFYLAAPGEALASRLTVGHGFDKATIVLQGGRLSRLSAVNNALMLLYAFATATRDTLLMHASVIKQNNKGYLFMGKSGTGKSTHSRLWLTHIKGSELLNDDNPVVRIENGTARVYGSPWSGKTPCYKNEVVPLAGMVKLQQALQNRIEKLSPLKAYAAILPVCSSMKWEKEMADAVHRTLETLTLHLPCYRLECLPDPEAAQLSYKTLIQEK